MTYLSVGTKVKYTGDYLKVYKNLIGTISRVDVNGKLPYKVDFGPIGSFHCFHTEVEPVEDDSGNSIQGKKHKSLNDLIGFLFVKKEKSETEKTETKMFCADLIEEFEIGDKVEYIGEYLENFKNKVGWIVGINKIGNYPYNVYFSDLDKDMHFKEYEIRYLP